MLKVTLYDGPFGSEVSYVEGMTEIGSTRKVRQIEFNEFWVCINFTNEETKEFHGFRYITDTINVKKPTKKRK